MDTIHAQILHVLVVATKLTALAFGLSLMRAVHSTVGVAEGSTIGVLNPAEQQRRQVRKQIDTENG